MTETHPLCPDCKKELAPHGECVNCDYEVNENYFDSSACRANLHDSEWENEADVTSVVKLFETSEANSFNDARGSFPYVGYAAHYPTGTYYGKMPMVTKGLPFSHGRLSEILRTEYGTGETTHPSLVAVYSRSTEPDMMLKVPITSDEYEIEEWSGRDSLYATVTDVLWSADDIGTTHPLEDIELGGVDDGT
jgi:hypothetical protein